MGCTLMHTGTIDLQSVQQFDGSYLFALKPRPNDQKLCHIEDLVDVVHRGICELYGLLVKHLNGTKIEQSPSPYSSPGAGSESGEV